MTHAIKLKGFWVAMAAVLVSFLWISSAQAAATAGDLIKCPDFSSVYYLSEDGNRNVFPDEGTYFSWYEDFEDVKEIDCEDLGDLPIGELVEHQAGIDLVTSPSTNAVYAVEPGGILREIDDEEMAETLYGEDWASRVRDVADPFFVHYDIGEPLEDGELPDGMFIEDEEGNLYRVSDGQAVEIDDVISETKQQIFSEHAVEMEAMQQELDDLGYDFDIQAFAAEMMDLFASEMAGWMQTVEAGDQLDTFYGSLEELGEDVEEQLRAELDDQDGDGLKDFWDKHFDDYDEENEEYWDEYMMEWDEMEYDVYYNDYWDDFEGEHAYDEWYDDYDEFWDEYEWDDEAYDEYYDYYEEFPEKYEYHDEWEDWMHEEDGDDWWGHYEDEYWDDEYYDDHGYEEGLHEEYDEFGNVIGYYYDLDGDGVEDSKDEIEAYYEELWDGDEWYDDEGHDDGTDYDDEDEWKYDDEHDYGDDGLGDGTYYDDGDDGIDDSQEDHDDGEDVEDDGHDQVDSTQDDAHGTDVE